MKSVTYEGHRAGSVTLDASGNGTIELDMNPSWNSWIVEHVNVRTNQPKGTTPVPQADTYLNDASVFDNHHGGTQDGNLDTGRGRITMSDGDTLLVVFTGGRPGDTAQASAYGPYTKLVDLP